MSNFYQKIAKVRENYIDTLGKLYDYATSLYAKKTLSVTVDGQIRYTYAEFKHKCDEISHRLSRYGIGAGDRVAILSQSHPNWTVAMFSLVAFGRVSVPILPDSSENEVTNILTHSGCKAIFVSKKLLSKVSEECRKAMTLVIDIETFDILLRDDDKFTCDGRTCQPQADDLATIIYTSGTTGKAKGVMLSHRNLCKNLVIAYHAHKTSSKDVWLSILPMAHTYEMSLGVLYPIYAGAKVVYLQKPPTPTVLVKALKTVRPTIMLSVPLVIEKIYRGSIVPTIEKSRTLRWMKEHMPALMYWLIGIKFKSTFGGRIKFFGIGGAKLNPEVEEFLKKAHFNYAIGYGMTECAPLICTAGVKQTRIGSTGWAAYGVEVKLQNVNPETGEGEIIVKGDNVMLGYYKDPERTREVFTDDGWFRTNDLAVQDEKGRFYIKGRLNNMILGPSGENIYPEEIEDVINNMEGVNESLVMEKDGKLVAMVHFDESFLNWDDRFENDLLDQIENAKKAVIDFVNKKVGRSSKIGDVEVMKEPFEKTATRKIRRFLYKKKSSDNPTGTDRNQTAEASSGVASSQEAENVKTNSDIAAKDAGSKNAENNATETGSK